MHGDKDEDHQYPVFPAVNGERLALSPMSARKRMEACLLPGIRDRISAGSVATWMASYSNGEAGRPLLAPNS